MRDQRPEDHPFRHLDRGACDELLGGPAKPTKSTEKFNATHWRTVTTGKFTFQCGFGFKQQNLRHGIDFYSGGGWNAFDHTTT